MSSAPVFIPGDLAFTSADQGIPVDHLALMRKGACLPESHETT